MFVCLGIFDPLDNISCLGFVHVKLVVTGRLPSCPLLSILSFVLFFLKMLSNLLVHIHSARSCTCFIGKHHIFSNKKSIADEKGV